MKYEVLQRLHQCRVVHRYRGVSILERLEIYVFASFSPGLRAVGQRSLRGPTAVYGNRRAGDLRGSILTKKHDELTELLDGHELLRRLLFGEQGARAFFDADAQLFCARGNLRLD